MVAIEVRSHIHNVTTFSTGANAQLPRKHAALPRAVGLMAVQVHSTYPTGKPTVQIIFSAVNGVKLQRLAVHLRVAIQITVTGSFKDWLLSLHVLVSSRGVCASQLLIPAELVKAAISMDAQEDLTRME